MAASPKIISFESAPKVFEALRKQGRKVVQSHGIFDLIHPGHISHLEEARALGDVLVVTLTADKHLQKGPRCPYFNEHIRTKSLGQLECVDFVVVVPSPKATEAIKNIRPDNACKGKEYEDPDFDLG